MISIYRELGTRGACYMLSLESLRKIDPTLEALTDDQIAPMRNSLYELASLALGSFRAQIKPVHKNPDWVLPISEEQRIL